MDSTRKKNPKIALILSAIFPGLGQLYNGEVQKGIGFLAAAIVLGWMSAATISLDALLAGEPPTGVGKFMVVSLLFVGCCAFSIFDAYRSAKK